jgi:hypothetical protein
MQVMMETFAMAPAESRVLWFLPVFVGVVLIGVIALLIGTALGSRGARFEVSPEGLRLRGDLYGRLIPAASLKAETIKRVDFAVDKELTPSWRTVGTAVPGYNSGWYKLKSGEKALLYLTDRKRAVYIATTEGYGVLVSPEDPDALITALRSIAK